MKFVTLAGSTRQGSVNVALAEAVATAARERGHEAVRIDLRDHPLPLFNADDEAEHGVPQVAHDLVAALDGADALVMVSPEYNGGFTPLLKNTIDWATRVEKTVWARTPVGLAAATPGGTGGRRGLALLRQLLDNIAVEVLDPDVSVPRVHEARDADGAFVREDVVDGIEALLDAAEAAVADRSDDDIEPRAA